MERTVFWFAGFEFAQSIAEGAEVGLLGAMADEISESSVKKHPIH
ncbi:hypothetical protein [Bradyrhizobium sp. 193]|nr:hypothetical protein [Bradyrhizobium sp. 193]